MIYAIILLALCVVYLYFRISYVRDKWTELLKQKTYVDKVTKIMDDAIMSAKMTNMNEIQLRKWSVEQLENEINRRECGLNTTDPDKEWYVSPETIDAFGAMLERSRKETIKKVIKK